MGCDCGKPKCDGHCGVSPAVLQINNPSECVLFHRVEVPASMGDSVTNPPKSGAYKNVLLYYEADQTSWLYSSDGIPQKLVNGLTDYEDAINLPKINGVTLIGDKNSADLKLADAPMVVTIASGNAAWSGADTAEDIYNFFLNQGKVNVVFEGSDNHGYEIVSAAYIPGEQKMMCMTTAASVDAGSSPVDFSGNALYGLMVFYTASKAVDVGELDLQPKLSISDFTGLEMTDGYVLGGVPATESSIGMVKIGNGLDVASDGTLSLDEQAVLAFDTVADMKQATNLVNGSYARTLGFHSVNDGGGAFYKITDTGTANEMDIIAIGDLFANLIQPAQINPQILGAYGDATHDDTNAIALALTYGKVLNFDHNKTYLADINIESSNTAIYNLRLKGTITFDSSLQFITLFNCDIDATGKNYGIYASDNVTKLRTYSVHVHDATLDNVHLVNCWDAILENVSSTGAGRDNFSLDVFNNGYLSGTSYFATNYGIKITNTKACTVIATVQECKKTGVYLNGVLGSDFRVYLEQNGYNGSTDEEKSQLVVGPTGRCVGCIFNFYAIGGSGSDMESKYGIYLSRSDDCTYDGFAEGHLEDGFRCTSNSHGNTYNVTDKTHTYDYYDFGSCKPQLYGMTSETSNSLITIEGGRSFNYIPVINGPTAYMVSFEKRTSTQGLIRTTDNTGTNVNATVNLFKYGTGIKTQ